MMSAVGAAEARPRSAETASAESILVSFVISGAWRIGVNE